MKRILTGIKSTGNPHFGNYIGAIKPAIALQENHEHENFYFIADYHALTSVKEPVLFKQYTYEIAATWLSLGLDPNKTIFYRQSDVPEIFELNWILSTLCAKGLMNRSHAYKSIVEQNEKNGVDADSGVNMGVYNYPILMSADILLFNTHQVPVGKDQIQHIEIARDLAEQFNKIFGETFVLPEPFVDDSSQVIPGTDGRKMSKSYGNTIPLFCEEKELKKIINKKITTDSLPPEAPKNPDTSTIFMIYQAFATNDEIKIMRQRFLNGIGYGEAKKELFSVINRELEKPREIYHHLMNDTNQIDAILAEGANKARSIAHPLLIEVKKKIGC